MEGVLPAPLDLLYRLFKLEVLCDLDEPFLEGLPEGGQLVSPSAVRYGRRS
jgi:hypothetical protein